jgi:hypothetical protein
MAFENKIAEAEAHLQEIKNIQQSYLTEMMNIKEKILECKNTLLNSIRKYDPNEEFGISREQYEGRSARTGENDLQKEIKTTHYRTVGNGLFFSYHQQLTPCSISANASAGTGFE